MSKGREAPAGRQALEWWLHGAGATLRRYPTSKDKGEKPQQDGRRGEVAFRIKPHSRHSCSEGSNKPCAPGPRDPTETETELCLCVSCGHTGQQWTAIGAGALGAADLVMTCLLLMEEVTINPPQSNQNLHRTGKQTLGGHKQNLVCTGTQEKEAVTPQETDTDLPVSVQESLAEVWVGSGLLQGWGD